MKMINTLLLSIILLLSCEKKCDLPKQIIGTGEIVENGLVLSVASTTTLLMNNQKEYIIQSESFNKDSLRVSFDDGVTNEFIDYLNIGF